MVERKRGSAGVKQRRERLRDHPVCAECAKRGIDRLTAIIDHVIPLALGGSDDDDNIQGLCLMCNAIKTAAENASAGGVANWPEWLKPSGVPLEIVSGPPCSGKSTYVSKRAEARDFVVDLDGILARLDPAYQHWSGALDPALFNKAIRVRNSMLGALAKLRGGRAYFIVSAPTARERQWWQGKLGGSIVLLQPGWDVCKARALQRGTLAAVAGVDSWRASSALHWSPPRLRLPKVGADVDGYPLEG